MTDGRLSREDILGGALGGRRQAIVLLAIEQRVRRLVHDDQRAAAGRAVASQPGRREADFLNALAGARTTDDDITITGPQLERFAPEWADMVPDDPAARAALFTEMCRRHRLVAERIAGIRSALGVDEPAVTAAFAARDVASWRSLCVEPSWREALRWRLVPLAKAVDRLPTSLLVFALVFTGTVGGGILALPLAIAAMGPGTAIALLGLAGLAYAVAMLAMVDALTRTAPDRRGDGSLGVLAGEHLGPVANRVASVALTVVLAVTIVGYVAGFGSAMAAATSLPSGLWGALLGAAVLLMAQRRSLDATVTITLIAGGLNLALLGIVTVAALSAASPSQAFDGIAPFELGSTASLFGVLFGLLASLFSAQVGVLNASTIALRRDPGGRDLLIGTQWALVAAFVFYSVFAVATMAAVPRTDLIAATDTVVGPLTEHVGRGIPVFAGAYVVLAMGVLTLQLAVGLRNQIRPLLPDQLRALRLDSLPTLVCVTLGLVFLASDAAVFVESLSIVGALAEPIAAGVIPALLLVVVRRRPHRHRDERPWQPPLVVAVASGVGGFFVIGIVLHATVVWDDPVRRVAATATLGLVIAIVVSVVRRGWLSPRLYVDLSEAATGGEGVVHVAPALDGASSVPMTTDGAIIGIPPAIHARIRMDESSTEVTWRPAGAEGATALDPPGLDMILEIPAGPGGILTVLPKRTARWQH